MRDNARNIVRDEIISLDLNFTYNLKKNYFCGELFPLNFISVAAILFREFFM
jgi:hypothetical protein